MASSAESTNAPIKYFSRAEVAMNKDEKSCWLIIHDNVYDVTGFLSEVSNFSFDEFFDF